MEHGELKKSFGAWKMTNDEEEELFSSLKKNWKKTTLTIRGRDRFGEQTHSRDENQV